MQEGRQVVSEKREDGLTPPPVQRCRYCRRRLRPADAEHKRFWPFCSERCKMAELGLWFEDRYRISRPLGEVTDDAARPGPSHQAGKRGDNP
jgi:endogenous inhibitor of DNA gyrase (YacG/DUF329 family)